MSHTSNIVEYFFSPQLLLALVISIALIPLLKRPALMLGLVDYPKGRKRHKEPVPLIGGPAILVSTGISLYIWGVPSGFEGMLGASIGLFVVGMIDDKYDISAKLRLLIQTSLVTAALWLDNNWISEVIITQDFTIYLGVGSYIISILTVLGVMNAINMLDGLDGLSAGVVLIILAFLISTSITAGTSNISSVGIYIFGSVLGFWAYNYRFKWRTKASAFLGDSGTTVLGFILPCLAIKLSIAAPSYAPKSFLLWLFAIPIWDICAVVIKRLRDGVSPLQARRDHIHHVLMNAGLSIRHSLHLIYLLTLVSISFGITIQYFSLTSLEAYIAFGAFLLAYLDRVGSLSQPKDAQVYDFATHGDRRNSTEADDDKVIPLKKRS